MLAIALGVINFLETKEFNHIFGQITFVLAVLFFIGLLIYYRLWHNSSVNSTEPTSSFMKNAFSQRSVIEIFAILIGVWICAFGSY
jgi:hypothetical protein